MRLGRERLAQHRHRLSIKRSCSVMKKLVAYMMSVALAGLISGQAAQAGQLMYIGTLDKKLLIIDEDKEEIADQIALEGIPRITALSADRKKLYIFTTQMLVETVDLEAKKVLSTFSIADPNTHLRLQGSAPDRINVGSNSRFAGLAVDPTGRYIYTTMRVVVNDIDQYRIEPPQFVAIDLQDKKFARAGHYRKEMDQGFGFNATYKVSPDG